MFSVKGFGWRIQVAACGCTRPSQPRNRTVPPPSTIKHKAPHLLEVPVGEEVPFDALQRLVGVVVGLLH